MDFVLRIVCTHGIQIEYKCKLKYCVGHVDKFFNEGVVVRLGK